MTRLGIVPQSKKVTGLIPSQGTCLGCGPSPQLGHMQEATNQYFSHRCFSPSISPILPLSLKINKIFKKHIKIQLTYNIVSVSGPQHDLTFVYIMKWSPYKSRLTSTTTWFQFLFLSWELLTAPFLLLLCRWPWRWWILRLHAYQKQPTTFQIKKRVLLGETGREATTILQEHQSGFQDAQGGHWGHLHWQEMPLHW